MPMPLLHATGEACQFYAALFSNICGPHKHQIHARNIWKYGTELLKTNYPIFFHRNPDTHLIDIGNRNINNIKIAGENANLCKKMQHRHFCEM